MSKDYNSYTAEDFVQDHWFREWVLTDNQKTGNFWDNWLNDHPNKRPDVVRAKALLQVLETGHRNLSSEEIEKSIDKVVQRVNLTRLPSSKNRVFINWLKYAASVSLIAGIIWMGVHTWNAKTHLSAEKSENGSSVWKKLKNDGAKPKTVALPDGSKVTLKPGATLAYVPDFEGKERYTKLTGEAYFEVVPNPQKPFLVVTDDLITRVLGTSFWVNSDQRTMKTIVLVHSGKVSVSRRDSSSEISKDQQSVLLMPNQQIVFSAEKRVMDKVLPAKPRMLHTPEGGKFIYEDKPIVQVFRDLEAAYGIKIIFDESLLANCQITATLGDEPFFEKLDLICRPIRATYQDQDGGVLISSKGCNY
jgi:transmembrane sensor